MTIYGRYYYTSSGTLIDRFDDTIFGTYSADTINGLGGSDTIYAGWGSDTVYGGAGNDRIYANSSAEVRQYTYWGNDNVFGGTGNDVINYSLTRSSVELYGDNARLGSYDGNDYIYSGSGNDRLYGGNGDDYVSGGYGDDIIYGDHWEGGGGIDTIIGGAGMDQLRGGNGNDTFVYNWGDSPATYAGSDIIYDFNGIFDKIDLVGTGTWNNYVERTIVRSFSNNFDNAQHRAQYLVDTGGLTSFVFITDGVDGYLFADADVNNTLDFGIELKGISSLSQFDYGHII